jgi:hypothetical protein
VVSANLKTRITENINCVIDTTPNINQLIRRNMIQANVKFGKVSNLLYTLMTQTKAKKFRAGFIKTDGSYRVGKFDLKNRETWKQADGTMYKRKGKKRTTNADEYILAHDLEKKAPRNISVARLLWFSVGKKIYKINRLKISDEVNVVMFEKVKFNHLKDLLSTKKVVGINE